MDFFHGSDISVLGYSNVTVTMINKMDGSVVICNIDCHRCTVDWVVNKIFC